MTDHGVSGVPCSARPRLPAIAGGGSLLEACSSGIQGASTSTSTTATSAAVQPAARKSRSAGSTRVTGSLAGFGYADDWVLQQVMASSAYKNGIKVGGSTYTVNVKSYDTSPA